MISNIIDIIITFVKKILKLKTIKIQIDLDEIKEDILYWNSRQCDEFKKLLLNNYRMEVQKWNTDFAEKIRQIYEALDEWETEYKKNAWQTSKKN